MPKSPSQATRRWRLPFTRPSATPEHRSPRLGPLRPFLKGSIVVARRMLGKRLRMWELLQKSLHKVQDTPALLPRLRRELGTFSRLLYRWLRGEYTRFSKTPLVLILAGLVYFINPMDLIVDLLPGIGYLDDAALIALLYQALRPELEKFEAWEREE